MDLREIKDPAQAGLHLHLFMSDRELKHQMTNNVERYVYGALAERAVEAFWDAKQDEILQMIDPQAVTTMVKELLKERIAKALGPT